MVAAEQVRTGAPRQRRPTVRRLEPSAASRRAPPGREPEARLQPFGVEALCARWRVALDAQAAALRAAVGSLPDDELAVRRRRLDGERAETLAQLKAFARARGDDSRFLHLTPHGAARRVLGLPSRIRACVFNLDGVLVPSATLHAAAWTEALDAFIWARTERTRGRFLPFDPAVDYPRHMHGRPRLDGVRAFLESRGISLPEGTPRDPPGAETVQGLARRKNEILQRRIAERGVSANAGSVAYLELAGEVGLGRAVVSASGNTDRILERSGLAPLIDVSVDGTAMVRRHLRPKPAPDVVLAACELLGADPTAVAAFETTEAGVVAARTAGCSVVLGIDQFGHAAALRRAGATPVVPSLAELLEERLAA